MDVFFYNDKKNINLNINKLPSNIKYKIFIIAMKQFWKEYIPLTAKIPSWYNSSIKQKELLFNALYHNIHFLHLHCNTLPEYKTYIIGCQCDFCKSQEGISDQDKLYLYEYLNTDYGEIDFINSMPYTESKWNEHYYIIANSNNLDLFDTGTLLKIFNPHKRNFSESWINNDSTTNDSDSDL